MSDYSRAKLVSYIVDSMESGMSIHELSTAVAAYLIENGKTNDVSSVMRDAQELRAQKFGTVELTVNSSHELQAEQLQKVENLARSQYTGANKILIHQSLDESLVGGASLTFPNASLDITIRNKLNRLREAVS